MSEEEAKVIHLYFSPEHIQEIDMHIAKNMRGVKNEKGRAYSRHDYFIDMAAQFGKELGLQTNPRHTKKTKNSK